MPFVCRLQSRNCERTLIFLPTKQITREVDLAIMNRAEPRDNSRTAESSITKQLQNQRDKNQMNQLMCKTYTDVPQYAFYVFWGLSC